MGRPHKKYSTKKSKDETEDDNADENAEEEAKEEAKEEEEVPAGKKARGRPKGAKSTKSTH
jgi:hypothetical protein